MLVAGGLFPVVGESYPKARAICGLFDLLTGITAFQRSTGEYLVFVEENYKARSLIYRGKS